MKPRYRKIIIRYVGYIILIELLILALVGIIGWRAGWSSWGEFRNVAQIAGILVIGIGFMGVKGSWDGSRSFGYQYSLSTTDPKSWERIQQTLVDFAQSYVFMLVMFITGSLSILIGWL